MFARHPVGAAAVTEIIGRGGPVEARTEGLTVRRAALPAGSHAELPVGLGRVTLAYLIDGAATTNGAHAVADDVVSLHGMDDLTVGAAAATDLLVVSVPASPSYEPRHVDPREMSRPGMAAGAR
jgi:redox-sensitive bicupin YhaK (pirin superfamily)